MATFTVVSEHFLVPVLLFFSSLWQNSWRKQLKEGADKMAQWVKTFYSKANNLTMIPESHVVEAQNWRLQLFDCHKGTRAHSK